MTGNSSDRAGKMNKTGIRILGVMSGSSLDALDLALCEFYDQDGKNEYHLLKTGSVPLTDDWKNKLSKLPGGTALEYARTDYDFGRFIGTACRVFCSDQKVDLIASHGHTIFHYPGPEGMTGQIGHGATIAAASGIDTICDFRSSDIAYGGQGAPIVAIFDRDHLGEYDILINLGGIVNVSINKEGKTIAYDIAPCNQLLNHSAKKLGFDFDENGSIAATANTDEALLADLLKDDYFQKDFPKSLDNNYIRDNFLQLLDNSASSPEVQLRTATELIVQVLAREVEKHQNLFSRKAMIYLSGGGVHNHFLLQRIREVINGAELIVPDKKAIDYKEAIMMAYLAYQWISERENVLASVTGATKDSRGGAYYKA